MTPVLGMQMFLLLAAPSSADQAAADLAEQLGERLQERPLRVLLEPLGDSGSVRAWQTELLRALGKSGVEVVEEQSVVTALEEAAQSQALGQESLQELAGAFGARVLLKGEVMGEGDGARIQLSAVSVATGEVLASLTVPFHAGAAATTEDATLNAQLRRLADRVVAGLDNAQGELRYQRVAVLPFEEVGETTQDKQLGLLVAAELTTTLLRDHNLLLVERAKLDRVIEELALGQTGLTDESQTVEVGKLAGAQLLVTGTVSEAGGQYLTSVRVVDVASGSVLVADSVSLPAAELVALSSEAVVLRTKAGAVYRSVLLPGWGQLYNREPVKAAVFVGAELLAAAGAVTFHFVGQQARDDYRALDAGAGERYDNKRARAEDAFQWRNTLLYGVAALHALNILDAYLSGIDYDPAVTVTGSGLSFQF